MPKVPYENYDTLKFSHLEIYDTGHKKEITFHFLGDMHLSKSMIKLKQIQ